MTTTQFVLACISGGIAIAVFLGGIIMWVAKQQRKLFVAENTIAVRTQVEESVSGQAKATTASLSTLTEEVRDMRAESTERHVHTETRLAEGSQRMTHLDDRLTKVEVVVDDTRTDVTYLRGEVNGLRKESA